MNWFDEYLRMNNMNYYNMTGDNPMLPWQMMGMPNPMFMPRQMMGGFNPMFHGFGFFPFGFFFPTIHHHHHHHHDHYDRDFDENREENSEEYRSNAYPYITPYY